VDFHIDSSAVQARVPYLILQPLAENAVRHAAAEREQGGRVVVRAARENGSLVLSIDDDGPGLQTSPITTGAPRTGLGLANTRERIAQRFGTHQRLVLGPSTLGGLRVALELPYRA
jgi:LytS/YehU family sensor histidine kinase